MKIALAGGDQRFLTAADCFKGLGYEILRVASGDGSLPPSQIPKDTEIIILPLPYQKDGRLNSPTSETSHDVGEILASGNESTLFFGGNLPETAKNYIDYAKIESFALKNALITAEGALNLALSLRQTALIDSQALVIGYGRIASHLTRLLCAFGCKTTVAARREEARVTAKSNGASALSIEGLTDLSSYDLIFNTVPHPVISERLLGTANGDALIIELASSSGFERESEKIIKASGLPGKFFPISAGKFIFEAIYPILIERGLTP